MYYMYPCRRVHNDFVVRRFWNSTSVALICNRFSWHILLKLYLCIIFFIFFIQKWNLHNIFWLWCRHQRHRRPTSHHNRINLLPSKYHITNILFLCWLLYNLPKEKNVFLLTFKSYYFNNIIRFRFKCSFDFTVISLIEKLIV